MLLHGLKFVSTFDGATALRATVIFGHLAQNSRFGIELAEEPRLRRKPVPVLVRGLDEQEVLAVEPTSALGEEGLQAKENFVVVGTVGVGHFFNEGNPLVDVARVGARENQGFLGRTQKVLVFLGGGVRMRDKGVHGGDVFRGVPEERAVESAAGKEPA